VFDLEHPERFFYILRRPQWKSWLARGAVLLIGLTVVSGLWWLLELGGYMGWWGDVSGIRPFFAILNLPLAVGVAVYTAFLFAQAEGRDLWQSSLLPFHLVVQALIGGTAVFAVADLFFHMHNAFHPIFRYTFLAALLVDLFITLVGEFSIPHATEVAAKAAHEITNGRYQYHFWLGSVLVGHIVPFLLAWLWLPVTWLISAVCVIAGLYLYEYAFVMAPQEIPNS
jgi:formate-dependent nitrite reductase membrane component NrfD